MTQTELETELELDLGRVRAALGPALADLSVPAGGSGVGDRAGGWTLRITIEREGGSTTNLAGGVALEECTEVSRAASTVLDADESLIPRT